MQWISTKLSPEYCLSFHMCIFHLFYSQICLLSLLYRWLASIIAVAFQLQASTFYEWQLILFSFVLHFLIFKLFLFSLSPCLHRAGNLSFLSNILLLHLKFTIIFLFSNQRALYALETKWQAKQLSDILIGI